MNTKQQGNIGLGQAIAYFTAQQIPVALPLNDSQRYDLVVELDGVLKKVEVKTTRYQERGTYVAMLKTCGGNQSRTGKTVKFDGTKVDLLFVYALDGRRWLIPGPEIKATTQLRLSKTRDCYLV